MKHIFIIHGKNGKQRETLHIQQLDYHEDLIEMKGMELFNNDILSFEEREICIFALSQELGELIDDNRETVEGITITKYGIPDFIDMYIDFGWDFSAVTIV